jgi:undecaprenyl-phosphate 4-deoxy-4-formamido-L-arabinose transferase
MLKKKLLSFVIPCYNSEKTIKFVVDEIIKTVTEENHYDYEIITVNDGSKDNVIDVLNALAEENKKIKVIDLAKNFGQHSALLTGLRHVSGDIIVCLDDDGQTPASECFRLINTLSDKIDVVYARYIVKHHSAFRNWGSRVNGLVSRYLIGQPKDLYMSSYFACKRYVADEVVKYDKPFPYLGGLVLRATNKITDVVIDHQDRMVGESNYNLGKLFSLWLNGFTAFSVKPLRIASMVGAFCSCCGFLYGLIIIIRKLIRPDVQLGYSSIMASILFIGGMIMLMLGLIGEYIGRIYISINNSPQSVIRDRKNL